MSAAEKRRASPVVETLRNNRRRRGITLSKLSELSQFNLSQISQIENGRVDPRLSSIETLAGALGLEVALVTVGTSDRVSQTGEPSAPTVPSPKRHGHS